MIPIKGLLASAGSGTFQVAHKHASAGTGTFPVDSRSFVVQADLAPAPPPPARVLAKQSFDRRVRARRLPLLAQLQPPPRHLDVDVGLGPAGQLLEHFVLA